MSKKNSLANVSRANTGIVLIALVCVVFAGYVNGVGSAETPGLVAGRRELEDIESVNKGSSWKRKLLIYLVFQAVVGVLAFEWAYSKVHRFREIDEERDQYYGAFRRQDAKHWARWKFYPGAMLTLTTRVILLFTGMVVLFFSISFLSIGHNFDKGPMPEGCRKRLIRSIYRACCGWGIFIAGMRTAVTYQDVDYSYYLGEGYKDKYRDIKKTSTLVCNHVSWLDALILIYIITPAFAPSSFFKTVPVFSTTCSVLDSIYIDRGADEATRQKTVNTILER